MDEGTEALHSLLVLEDTLDKEVESREEELSWSRRKLVYLQALQCPEPELCALRLHIQRSEGMVSTLKLLLKQTFEERLKCYEEVQGSYITSSRASCGEADYHSRPASCQHARKMNLLPTAASQSNCGRTDNRGQLQLLKPVRLRPINYGAFKCKPSGGCNLLGRSTMSSTFYSRVKKNHGAINKKSNYSRLRNRLKVSSLCARLSVKQKYHFNSTQLTSVKSENASSILENQTSGLSAPFNSDVSIVKTSCHPERDNSKPISVFCLCDITSCHCAAYHPIFDGAKEECDQDLKHFKKVEKQKISPKTYSCYFCTDSASMKLEHSVERQQEGFHSHKLEEGIKEIKNSVIIKQKDVNGYVYKSVPGLSQTFQPGSQVNRHPGVNNTKNRARIRPPSKLRQDSAGNTVGTEFFQIGAMSSTISTSSSVTDQCGSSSLVDNSGLFEWAVTRE